MMSLDTTGFHGDVSAMDDSTAGVAAEPLAKKRRTGDDSQMDVDGGRWQQRLRRLRERRPVGARGQSRACKRRGTGEDADEDIAAEDAEEDDEEAEEEEEEEEDEEDEDEEEEEDDDDEGRRRNWGRKAKRTSWRSGWTNQRRTRTRLWTATRVSRRTPPCPCPFWVDVYLRDELLLLDSLSMATASAVRLSW